MECQAIDSSKKTFLDLAAELRNRIYFLCLALPDGSKIELRAPSRSNSSHAYQITVDEPSTKQPTVTILATCKAIHNEATAILYGSNTFKLYNTNVMSNLSSQICSSTSLLRNLQIEDNGVYHPDELSRLRLMRLPLINLMLPLPEGGNYESAEIMARRLLRLMQQMSKQREANGGEMAVEKIVRFVPSRTSMATESDAEEYGASFRRWMRDLLEKEKEEREIEQVQGSYATV